MSGLQGAARAVGLLGLCLLTACGSSTPSDARNGGGVLPPVGSPGAGASGAGGQLSGTPTGGLGGPTGAGAGAAGSGAITTAGAANTIPCDVATVVATRCQMCHGAALVGGAPMHLVSYADFQADLTVKTTQGLVGQTMKAYALAKQRINSTSTPMPPGSTGLAPADLATLDGWLAAGAPSGTVEDATCATAVPPPIVEPPTPTTDPNETCYELAMHGGQGPTDTSPFTILDGERYHCFYYTVPWTEQVTATRFGNKFDNTALIHHWLLYTTDTSAPGTSGECTGSHIGDNAQLLSGWAVGGQDLVMPPDTGLQLPAPGTNLLVEWHLYNTTGMSATGNSAMQICTVPKGTRPKEGSMTSLGTEDFGLGGIPVGMQTEYTTTCVPSRAGMNATDPIHLFAFLPHMHKLGRNLRSVVNRANGMQETVFDKPFDFNQQIHYEVSVDMQPGDTITSTCTFMNDTTAPVAFGPSSSQEMCYQFVLSSPAGALKNGVFGLNGASTNCW